jgi:hypothetical protein
MSRSNDLPFERGSTYWGGDATLLTAAGTDANSLEGRVYETVDPISLKPQRLIVLKNTHSAAIAGGRGVRPAAAQLGKRTGDYVGTTGGFGYIVDPEYARLGVTVAVNDMYYGILDGNVSNVKLGASNAVDFGVMIFDTAGYVIPVGANDDCHIVGRCLEAVTSTGAGNEAVDMAVGAVHAGNFDRT